MEIKRFEKRGQELSIGTLILIVLGIIVLVLLVLGFSMGWSNLFSKVGIYSGNDLSAMVSACKVAVASQSTASYCEFKNVKFDDGIKEINCEFKAVSDELGANKLELPNGCPNKGDYCQKIGEEGMVAGQKSGLGCRGK